MFVIKGISALVFFPFSSSPGFKQYVSLALQRMNLQYGHPPQQRMMLKQGID